MIRAKTNREFIIDITGPAGNAFVLLGYANKFAKELGLDADAIMEEMKTGDYENLLKVFDNYFGSFVIIER